MRRVSRAAAGGHVLVQLTSYQHAVVCLSVRGGRDGVEWDGGFECFAPAVLRSRIHRRPQRVLDQVPATSASASWNIQGLTCVCQPYHIARTKGASDALGSAIAMIQRSQGNGTNPKMEAHPSAALVLRDAAQTLLHTCSR